MTCHERHDLILLYAADALEPAEREMLRQHLSGGCIECASRLAEAEATLAHVPMALDQVAPPPMAKTMLMRRIATPSRRESARPKWLSYTVAAGLGIVIGAVGWQILRDAPRQARIRQLETALANRDAQLGDLVKVIRANEVSLVGLTRADPQPRASGRILWDKDTNHWHVWVFDMQPPPPGREYELWFITPDQRKIAGGTFKVDASGNGTLTWPVPPNIGPIALAAITDEPLGGVQNPTGAIHLSGKVE